MKMGPNYLLSYFERRNFAGIAVKRSTEKKTEKNKYIYFCVNPNG